MAMVVPSFNQARFLDAAIASVCSQNYPSLCVAVVDGASSDGSQAVLDKWRARVDFCISEPDAGQYDAINKGFAKVSGEVMGWLNSDDLHAPWTLAVAGGIFARFPEVEWLTTRYPLRWDADGRATQCRFTRGYARAAFAKGEYCPGIDGFFAAPIQQESTFWRRTLWEKAGGAMATDAGAAGDFELWCRFAREAELYAVDTPLAGFRVHGAQQSLAARDEYCRQATRALDRHFVGARQSALYRRLRPMARDRAPEAIRPLLRGAGLLFDAPVVVRDRANTTWRIERVVV